MSAQGTIGAKRTHVRWAPILVLVLFATTVNYLDRTIFGIAIGQGGMGKDLGLDDVELYWLASAFGWTYAFMQIPGGIFLDRFGVRVTYALSLMTWSLFCGLQGIANSFWSLFGYRLGLGMCETPCFPANSRILATWFPQNERARANSVYAVGQYAGIAFLSYPLVWITVRLGWQALFISAGVIGIFFGLYFYGKYHEPHDSKTANQAELDYIEAGGGLAPKGARVKFDWRNAWKLIQKRQILVASLAQFCGNTVLVFFLYSFLKYLSAQRHMEFLTAGVWNMLPYLAAAAGVLFGGQLSDLLLKTTKSANIGRKVPITLGFLMASCLALANYVPQGQDGLVIAFMCIAFAGQGMTNLGWTVISDVAPKSMIGLTGGVFNLITNLAGILTPLIIGYIVKFSGGDYTPAIFYVGAMPLIGAFLYIFLLGDIKRLSIDDKA